MPTCEPTIHEIVERLGRHTATTFGIDLDDESQLDRWLIAVCLTGARVDDARWEQAFRNLDRDGLTDPTAIARPAFSPEVDSDTGNDRGPGMIRPTGASLEVGAALEAALRAAELPDAERVAWKLIRVSAALCDHYAGSVNNLVRGSDNLEELGGRLAALAPGFGTASVTRFLRPLRDRWIEASELPLHAAAHAAAVHVGLLDEFSDLESAPGALRASIADIPDAPAFPDLEAALERLGGWCRRSRTKTCPLGDQCPARMEG